MAKQKSPEEVIDREVDEMLMYFNGKRPEKIINSPKASKTLEERDEDVDEVVKDLLMYYK